MGHSYGGARALRLALQSHERLRSLTLIEPVAFHLLRRGGRAEQARYAEIAALPAPWNGACWSGMERVVDYWNGGGRFARLGRSRARPTDRRSATLGRGRPAARQISLGVPCAPTLRGSRVTQSRPR